METVLSKFNLLKPIFPVLAVSLACVLADLFAKRFLLGLLSSFSKRTKTNIDDLLLERKVFSRLAHLAPAIVVYLSLDWMLPNQASLTEMASKFLIAYIIVICVTIADAIVNVTEEQLNRHKTAKNLPLRSYFQVTKLILYTAGVTLFITTLIDKSPWALLSGLGAMTAVLLLVFKDSIMGLVASIQLSANQMVKPGDWIEIPGKGIDGEVLEVSLNTVKVQNWDKTISSIPTYELISGTFKNWKGMSDSGGRRIKRAVNIDMTSVHFADSALIEKLKKVQLLNPYLLNKESELISFNKDNNVDTTSVINGRRLTNLGLLRAYLESYLKTHPKIHQSMTLIVRQLAPTPNGIPLEIYTFSSDQDWARYESIQSDIFDHLLAIIPEFELKVFQNPTGSDFAKL